MTKEKYISIHNQFSIIYRHGKMMHDRAMRCFGLTGQQMGYMRMIHEHPGISQEAIVRMTRIDKGAVAKSIRDMVDKGYVIRNQNPEDKRAYFFSKNLVNYSILMVVTATIVLSGILVVKATIHYSSEFHIFFI